MKDDSNTYDVIVIGSGMGGLSAASILAQMYGKRVLVLEQHFKAGGFTHIFKRESKYRWDVGVHYVGDMQKGSQGRVLFDYISQGKLNWLRMPDVYDVFDYPGLRFEAHTGKDRIKSDLQTQFPEERDALEQYFRDIKTAADWLGKHMMFSTFPGGMRSMLAPILAIGRSRAIQTTKRYLDSHFKDEKLKAVLVSQWGDYGLPPAESPFMVHAAVADHYFEGGWYPEGGAGKIAGTIVPVIEKAGGAVLVNHEVREILVKHNTAYGVCAAHKKGSDVTEVEYFAGAVVSDAGAWATYLNLLPDSVAVPFLDELRQCKPGPANVSVFIGLKDSPETIGIKGENYWLYEGFDHDAHWSRRNELLDGKVTGAYVSFPSLKDRNAEGHTAEILAFCDFAPFAKWADKKWKNRGDEYEQVKSRIGDALVDFTEERLPGFKALIDYVEVSTPLSTQHFTAHREGSIYGLPATPERFRMKWLGPRMPVQKLYLAGSDATMPGILPAAFSGVLAAGIASGGSNKIMGILKKAMEYHKGLG